MNIWDTITDIEFNKEGLITTVKGRCKAKDLR